MKRIFLDTNVYIVGADNLKSNEGLILTWLGFQRKKRSDVEVVASNELLEQVARVAKRIRNKDWSGEIIDRIWWDLNVCFVLLDQQTISVLESQAIIPREDVGVYLTAKLGKADCFVSANYKLIRSLIEETQKFECLTPAEFVEKYLKDDG